jgi:hypothetical protein
MARRVRTRGSRFGGTTMNKIVLVLALALLAAGPVLAQGAFVPGRSLGRVALGMPRADVWKTLGRPARRRIVRGLPAPHPLVSYTLDTWDGSPEQGARFLFVLCRNGQVIQIEDSGPRILLGQNVSWVGTSAGTFTDIRRRYPRMRVEAYDFTNYDSGHTTFYADDVRDGIAFTLVSVGDSRYDYNALPASKPDTLVIHAAGSRALPVTDDLQMIVTVDAPTPDSMGKYLPQMRAWFAGDPHHTLPKK